MSYNELLARRIAKAGMAGRVIQDSDIHPSLMGFQREIVAWAVAGARRAVWADTGLGKTRMQLEWCRLSADVSLIVAPLAVCDQTVEEAAKIGIKARYVRHASEMGIAGVYVTNYEMVQHFPAELFGAVALDEASILKQSTGKTRNMLIDHFQDVKCRTAWTATPGPNDPEELTNQAEFLGVMSRTNMLAAYFIHDQDGWRQKKHAVQPMAHWMNTWAMAIRKPSDLGYDDDGYILPGLEIIPEIVDTHIEPDEGELFAAVIGGVSGRAKVRRETLADRCDRAIELIQSSHEETPWDGNLSTQKTGERNTTPTQKNGNAANLKGDVMTPNTCGSTTKTTKTSGPNEPLSNSQKPTPDNANGTQPIPSTGRSASNPSEPNPRIKYETEYSAEPTGSAPKITTKSLSSRATDAQYAEGTETDVGTTSTTTMTQGKSGASSAPNATLGSESSKTIQSSWETQSDTYSKTPERWVLWCGLNDEQDYLAKRLGDLCFSVDGSMSPEKKVELLHRWLAGERPVLLTKPSIHGMGINMQHCARTAFVGLSDSYESYYQCIRRFYRFGQERVVNAHIILSSLEQQIAANVAGKERQMNTVMDSMIAARKALAA